MSEGPLSRPLPPEFDRMAHVPHTLVQLVTTAPVDRRKVPKSCDSRRFHVWCWDGPRGEDYPALGVRCRCGLLTWEDGIKRRETAGREIDAG